MAETESGILYKIDDMFDSLGLRTATSRFAIVFGVTTAAVMYLKPSFIEFENDKPKDYKVVIPGLVLGAISATFF